jgi:DNA invertase Pin-like site-specific DNA recombinase
MAELDRTVFPQVVAGPDLERRAAVYARVSTANGQDPQMQIREMCEYCQRRGWPIVREYVDLGISGARHHLPSLSRMRGAISNTPSGT